SGNFVTTGILKQPAILTRRLYDWTIHWSGTKSASWALFFIAFAESSFFPIPPDVLLTAMVLGNQRRWLRSAAICTIGSVSGALLGYLIGWTFYETAGKTVVEFYGLQAGMEMIGNKYEENAFLTVLTAAFTPIPFKVITIGAGLFKIPLGVLIFASVLGRAGRFFLVAGLLRLYGAMITKILEKYFNLFTLIFMLLLIGGFMLLRFL
ncbi:MAG: YqaA family protein, partial [Smithellaceae bacterium]|nr:YqaA family protein [Smithellaceae bacterium]